jgi:hypothetical protein
VCVLFWRGLVTPTLIWQQLLSGPCVEVESVEHAGSRRSAQCMILRMALVMLHVALCAGPSEGEAQLVHAGHA